MCGESRIRVLAGGESPKGWLWRSPSREGRWGKWVSCEWRSGGVGKRPSSGDGTRHRQSRLRDSPPGQGSWSRVSANRICWHIWNRICEIAATLTYRAFVHKSLGTPLQQWQMDIRAPRSGSSLLLADNAEGDVGIADGRLARFGAGLGTALGALRVKRPTLHTA